MTNYEARRSQVLARQLKVQTLAVPFSLVGNATSTSVVLRCDEPGFVFFRSAGVDQITAALRSNETATYTTSASDSLGVVQVFIRIDEALDKVVSCRASLRNSTAAQACILGSATGITTGTAGGTGLMLVLDLSVDLAGANTADGCLELAYTVA